MVGRDGLEPPTPLTSALASELPALTKITITQCFTNVNYFYHLFYYRISGGLPEEGRQEGKRKGYLRSNAN
jgi:hypothetical protein